MRTRTVKRHYCDYCKKAMSQRPAMERHERVCTMNPNRHCDICETSCLDGTELAELIAVLPQEPDIKSQTWNDEIDAAITAAIPTLRNKADGCPACMLAALRQSGMIKFAVTWSYGDEHSKFWKKENRLRMENIPWRGGG